MPNIAVELGNQASSLGARTAYGDPIEVDGISVTPVALTVAGFGGGTADQGEGGGGGGMTVPLGVYMRREEGLRFEPNPIVLLAVAVPFVCVLGRALTRIIRALKK
ncbi:hypothetical protein Q9R19_05580 [Microbacterium sp. ARD32]|uniref:hypothetical protein n=1 Tax=Microbacterium sp. ARD32 TaxID=2962577 RepID=UPI002882AC23|nr:hypothetical protein [Microbacterium sp. ARD32]MDT0157095.1 hypothetical protein [Microbacterium sp. ARD32]